MSIEQRVAVITGATGPAGRAVAADLAAAGARVVLVGTQGDRLEAMAADLDLPGDRTLLRPTDLRHAQAAGEVVTAALERFGRLDILAHLVGGWTGGPTTVETADAEFGDMLDRHLWTTLHMVRAAVPVMTAAGWGRIVAVSSPVVRDPVAKSSAYAVGKATQEALLGTLARELAGTGVTANVLLVRAIDAARERVSAPAPRNASWTTPEELAAAVRWLVSDEAAAVNGARIPLYGAG